MLLYSLLSCAKIKRNDSKCIKSLQNRAKKLEPLVEILGQNLFGLGQFLHQKDLFLDLHKTQLKMIDSFDLMSSQIKGQNRS